MRTTATFAFLALTSSLFAFGCAEDDRSASLEDSIVAPDPDAMQCAPREKLDGVTVFNGEHGSIRYLPTRFAIKALWFGVVPANDYLAQEAFPEIAARTPFVRNGSAARYRLEPAPLTKSEIESLQDKFGAQVKLEPMPFSIDATHTQASFLPLPTDQSVPTGILGTGPADISAVGEAVMITGWLWGFARLNAHATLAYKNNATLQEVSLAVRIPCGKTTSVVAIRQFDWSAVNENKHQAFDSGGSVLNWVSSFATSVQRPTETAVTGSILYLLDADTWSQYGQPNFVPPTRASHAALATAIFPEIKTIVERLGTPELTSKDVLHSSDVVENALESFIDAYLTENGVVGADIRAVLADLENANTDAAARSRLPAPLVGGHFFPNVIVNIYRSNRTLKDHAPNIDAWNAAL